ncbi:MAG TPA: PAS domain-containing protein, partial [Terracidiphilus sp.]
MEPALKQADDEIKRLQSYINDLISVQALPAIWSGLDAHQIVNKLLEVLTSLLRLDFAGMRMNNSNVGPPIEAVRLAPDRNPYTHSHELRALEAWLKGDLPAGRVVISNPIGTGDVTIAPFRVGLQDEIGVVVAASARTDFPTDMERLLLRVAVNQAVIGLQEVRRSGEQNRVAEALDQLVAERTKQLMAANEEVKRSEAFLAQGQRISHTGSFGWNVSSGEIYWSEETYRIFEHIPSVQPTLDLVFQRTHPDDRNLVRQKIDRAARESTGFDLEHRLLMPDGSLKHIHVLARALETSPGNLEFVGAVTDVTAAKQAELKLRESEAYLAEAQRLSNTGSWAWNPSTGENRYWSDECFRLMGFDPAGGMPAFEIVVQRFHPEDRPIFAEELKRASRDRGEFELDYRIVHPGGEIRDIHAIGHPVLGPSGDLVEFVGSVIDVTERKKAEDNIRQSENELRRILDFAPQQIAVLGPDRTRIYSNQAMLDYLGFSLEEWQSSDPRRFVHPDDFERMMSHEHNEFLKGLPHEVELRLLGIDQKYRWFLVRYSPLRDEQGGITRWYLAGTDIEDRKQAEQRLHDENVALREEIDRASMYEEIVGTSPALRAVLSRVSKVAPTDSTVLITGETGTGKELIARAIHRRSQRSS